MAIEKKFGEEEKAVLTRHERSGSCDPAKKQKPRCPVKRCKEVLTFSNCNTCKKCNLKVCLKHRFPSDHLCKGAAVAGAKLPIRMPVRNGLDCREKGGLRSPPPSVKAYWLGLRFVYVCALLFCDYKCTILLEMENAMHIGVCWMPKIFYNMLLGIGQLWYAPAWYHFSFSEREKWKRKKEREGRKV